MCFRVDCEKCGKFSWGGCGKHLTTLYASIDKGKHCMCKSWPGVAIPLEDKAKDNRQKPGPEASASTTVNAFSCPQVTGIINTSNIFNHDPSLNSFYLQQMFFCFGSSTVEL